MTKQPPTIDVMDPDLPAKLLKGLASPHAAEVAKAERVLNNLRQKRDALVAHGHDLGEERTKLAFAAHAGGDGKARERLDAINREAALHDSELRSLDAAISEAAVRVEKAQAAERDEVDRERAVEILEQVERLKVAGRRIDDALAVVVEAGAEIHAAADELHRLDCPTPSGQQLLSFGERALRSAIQQTLWNRCIERLAPGERTTFSRVIEQWGLAIERRFGDAERTDTENAA
jgi:hypothetical protein